MKTILAIACTAFLVTGKPMPPKKPQTYDYATLLANVHTKPGSPTYTVDQWGAPKRFV